MSSQQDAREFIEKIRQEKTLNDGQNALASVIRNALNVYV
jgi:hypothetical protein